jgi:RNA ligase
MKAKFPQIRTLDCIRPFIEGREDIRIMPREHGFTVNYLVSLPDTWGDAEARPEEHWVRRECRGLLFDTQGKLISRPYHKFFNLNEKPFTAASLVDLSEPHVILEKLDGSMIRPFLRGGEVRWGTKMGETDIARNAGAFAERDPRLMEFVRMLLHAGHTPIFEWCSRSQRIVVDYPRDRLVLTAIRNIELGNYVTYAKMCDLAEGLDIVQAIQGEGALDDVVRRARSLNGEEGWIIRFDLGEMVKLKADEYVRQHRALDGLRWEKDVLALILAGEADDVRGIVAPEVRAQLDEFERVVNEGVIARAHVIEAAVQDARAQGLDRKAFALGVAAAWDREEERSVLFRVYQGAQAADEVIALLKKRVGSQTDVDSVRWVWGDFAWNVRTIGDLDV